MRRIFIAFILLMSLASFAYAAESKYLPYTMQEILDAYQREASLQGLPPLEQKNLSEYITAKDCSIKFIHLDSQGHPEKILVTGPPSPDFKYFPYSVESLLIVYDILTQGLSLNEKSTLTQNLQIKENPKTHRITAYGKDKAGGMMFDITLSTTSGLYLEIVPFCQ